MNLDSARRPFHPSARSTPILILFQRRIRTYDQAWLEMPSQRPSQSFPVDLGSAPA